VSRPGAAAWAGGAIVAGVVLFAVIGPLVAPHDAYTSDFVHGASPLRTPIGPCREFWLGADRIYRDEFARLAVGARFSLLVGVLATAIATGVGGGIGLVAGWFEGTEGARVSWPLLAGAAGAVVCALLGHPGIGAVILVGGAGARAIAGRVGVEALMMGPRVDIDGALMRAVDIGLAFPFLLLVMAVGAALGKASPVTVACVLGLTGWLGTARVVRAKTMQVRSLDFVLAARAIGRSTPGILWGHVLPNVSGLLLAVATVSVAQMILIESALAYLGVGVPPPSPTWGRMILEGQDYLLAGPWMVAAPATAIVIATIGFHLLGEGLRDALDARR